MVAQKSSTSTSRPHDRPRRLAERRRDRLPGPDDPPRGAGFPPFRLVRSIEGRREDALRLENGRGERVEVHPAFLLGALLELPGARQVCVVQEVERIEVSLVVAGDGAGDLPAAVGRWFEVLARERDLRLPRVVVRVVPRLGGTGATMGKFRPVECRLPA